MVLNMNACYLGAIFVAGLHITFAIGFCSNGSVSPHTGYCYYLHPLSEYFFPTARNTCRSEYGGDVPSIWSDSENDFLSDVIEGGTYELYWLGITDISSGGGFRDIRTNQGINYTNFDQWPDDSGQTCIRINKTSGLWAGGNCWSVSPSIGLVCQVPPKGTDPNTGCPPNMLPYFNTTEGLECFWFSLELKSAYNASSHCTDMGAKLAKISDPAMNNFLNGYLPTLNFFQTWIGYQEVNMTNGYTTVEFGSSVNAPFTYFEAEYKGSDNPVCVIMFNLYRGRWIQKSCDTLHHYICSYTTTIATATISTTSNSGTTIQYLTSTSGFTTSQQTTTGNLSTTTSNTNMEVTTSVDTTSSAAPVEPPTTHYFDTTSRMTSSINPATTSDLATTVGSPTTQSMSTTHPIIHTSILSTTPAEGVTTDASTLSETVTHSTFSFPTTSMGKTFSETTRIISTQSTPPFKTATTTTTITTAKPLETTNPGQDTPSATSSTQRAQETPIVTVADITDVQTTTVSTTTPVTMVTTDQISTSSTCVGSCNMTTEDMNPCTSKPCLHGGTCTDNGGGFSCECAFGFQGPTCAAGMNPCDSNPCLNGATCLETLLGLVCRCPFGFEGTHCETDLTPDFNFSRARGLGPADFGVDRNAYQPYYTLADHYNPLQNELGNDHQDITEVPCRDNMMDCIKLTASTSRLNPMTSLTGTCLQEVENCPQGFAISMWLYLDSAAIDGVPSKLLSVEDGTLNVPYVRLMITAQRAIEFSVNDGSALSKTTISAGKVLWNRWFNFGASWKPGSTPLVFVNSNPKGHSSQTDVTEAMDTSTNRQVLLGSRESADSSAPVTVSDFVYWDRFLFDFENHRYLGMTNEELHFFFTADHWWTVDGFARRDHLLLADYLNDVASTTPIRTDENAVVVLTTGRDSKGSALDVNGEDGFWLYFGEHGGTCISDPSLCDDGITVSTWMRLTDHHDNEFHCLLSSGGQTTRGFALYQTGQKLRAIVANGERQWIVEVPFDEFDEWTHIALTWNLTTGLYLYLEGDTRGIDMKGVYRIRDADLDNKLIVGRRNDFLSDFARVGFEELAIWERFVEPWEAKRVFGLVDNCVYSKAVFFWSGQAMITSSFELLQAGKKVDIIPGPSSDVTTVIENSETYVELHPGSYLSLGTFPTSCLTETDACLTGFSLSIWLKTPVNAPITGHHLSIESRSFTLTVTYYTAVAIVKTSDLVWTTTVPIAKRGAWYNIAVTWNRFESLVVYVDGIKPDGATSTTETNTAVQPSSATEVGISSTTEGTLITDLALWYQFTYPRKAFSLMGLTDSESYCQSFGRYCWTFHPPLSRVNPFTASDTGISYTTSSNFTGMAVVTDGFDGYLTLGDFEGACPSDPSECDYGFALGLWVKLEAPETVDSAVRHIVSLGADKNGEKGMALVHAESKIRAIVADGTKRWEVDTSNHNVTYGEWMYISMIWEATDGLKIVFDGVETAEQKTGTVNARNKEAYSVITVGKSAVYPIGYQAGAYDEIMLVVPDTADSIPVPEDLNGVGSVRYRSADEYFDVTDPSGPVDAVNTSLVEDRFHTESGAVSTGDPARHNFGYVSIGDYGGKCLSDPSICSPAGMTVSFWVKLNTIEHFQDVATNPEGLGYILSSGAQVANSRGFSVTYDGSTVTTEAVSSNIMWTASFEDSDFGKNWTNFAITWSSVSGLEVLTDGELTATDPLGTPLSSATTDQHTAVHLGKRNDQDSGYLGGAFDDVAVWIYTIDYEDDDELSQLLGELGLDDIFITDDYTQLLNSAPTTGKEECRVLHEADCARSLTELEDITNEELFFDHAAQTSMRRRLLHLAQTEDNLSTNELTAAVNVASTLALVVQPFNNQTLAENAIEEFIQAVNALLDVNRTDEWIELQKVKRGSTALVHSLEDYIAQAARDLETSNTFLGCQNFYETTTIATCVDKFVSDSFGSNGPVTFPVYGNESEWRGVEARWNNLQEVVTLPQNLFDFTLDGDEGIIVLSIYDALDEVIPRNTTKDFVSSSTSESWVNSRVVSLKVYPSLRRELYNPVSMVFVHNTGVSEGDTYLPVCAFWNYYVRDTNGGSWDKTGCEMVATNRTHTTCECTHFTHFAVLMEPPPPPPPDIVDMVFVWSARILAGISAAFLLLLIFIFICCTRVRTLRHLIHANVAISVLIAILFLCLATVEWTPIICVVMGALFEYFSLVFVFWLLIEAIQALTDVHFGYRKADLIIKSCPLPERYYGFMCLAWGAPALVVGVTVAIDIDAFGELDCGLCWVTDEHDLYLSFYGPLGVCFGLTMLFLFIVNRGLDKFINTGPLRSSMLATCVISLVNIGAWAAGYIGLYGPTVIAYYVYLITFASMGIFIFLMYGLSAGQLKLIFGKKLKGRGKVRAGRSTPVEKISITPDQENAGKKKRKKRRKKEPLAYVPGGKDHWSRRESSKLPGRTNASVRIQPRADIEKKIILS